MPTATKKASKATKAPAIRHESKIENPVDFVWQYAHKHHRELGRAECCRQLEKMGIAHYTARTQYQRAHTAGYPKNRKPKASK